ncbi:MAG: hypothetical protein ACREQ3_24075 [Candidatus Binatia bacterium]
MTDPDNAEQLLADMPEEFKDDLLLAVIRGVVSRIEVPDQTVLPTTLTTENPVTDALTSAALALDYFADKTKTIADQRIGRFRAKKCREALRSLQEPRE